MVVLSPRDVSRMWSNDEVSLQQKSEVCWLGSGFTAEISYFNCISDEIKE